MQSTPRIQKDFSQKNGMNMKILMLYFQKLRSSLRLRIELTNFQDTIGIRDLNFNLLILKFNFEK